MPKKKIIKIQKMKFELTFLEVKTSLAHVKALIFPTFFAFICCELNE
jgi:hypothetical protein